MRTMRALVATVLLAGSGLLVPAAEASTLPSGVREEVLFSDPVRNTSTWRDARIADRLVRMVDETPAGETIRGSLFALDWAPFTDAVIRARARGVTVRIAANGRRPLEGQFARLKTALGANFVHCNTANPVAGGERVQGCIPAMGSSYMHSKFFMFSRTGDRSRVVAVTSFNLERVQTEMYNNMLVMSGDSDTYSGYRRYFDDLFNQRKNNDYMSSANGTFSATGTLTRTQFFPRADSSGGTAVQSSTDPVVQALKPLTGGSGCYLKAQLWHFNSERRGVLDQLVRVRAAGCTVRVLYSNADSAGLAKLAAGGVSTRKVSVTRANGALTRVHDKTFMFKGTYDGTAGVRRVYTGSHNWTRVSLRKTDEILLRAAHDPVLDAFNARFDELWARHA